ncbi:hypothetical protein [Streptomyces roseolus]|uniref:hypothetical protein n=1 Tax=Streptomyces roseolus TaxID=67358 RepID=UPI0016753ABC|nr:hypothetical protein [Streptomyces roseolus]GGR28333.1 hypothetical protein GCM10010282_20900 [Streptomyces roseolus]
MARAVRWGVAGVAALVTFGLGVTLVRALPWGWLPREDGARLDTALAFGAIAGTAVLGALSWWAARDRPPTTVPATAVTAVTAPTLLQTATASDDAEIRQSGGGVGAPHLEQHAEARDSGRVTQSARTPGTGTDTGTRTGTGYDRIEQRGTATGRARVVQSGADDRPAERT